MRSDVIKISKLRVMLGLNPTLDWICALTLPSVCSNLDSVLSLNPTLDWICALTEGGVKFKLKYFIVLILLWTGYVL